jgi:hypothetical protein
MTSPQQNYWLDNLTHAPDTDNRTSRYRLLLHIDALALAPARRRPQMRRRHALIPAPHSSTAGNSDFLKRQPTEPGRIPYASLRDLNDLLCNKLSDGIGPVAQLQGSQAILVGRDKRSDILGCKGAILQKPVNGHNGAPVEETK